MRNLLLRDSKVPQNLLGLAQFEFPEVPISAYHRLVSLVSGQATANLSLEREWCHQDMAYPIKELVIQLTLVLSLV